MAEIKFCGLTRPEDARVAGQLGAAYVGVIFAGGPRNQTPERARAVLDGCEGAAKRVGVFRRTNPADIARVVQLARLDVVQLHGAPTALEIEETRDVSGADVWAVINVADALPPNARELFAVADAVVLDAKVEGMLGGTGVPLPWRAIAKDVKQAKGGGKLVLAGGLRPENIALALHLLAPDVVDVASGVESSPGIKDHAQMRAFAAAAANQSETL